MEPLLVLLILYLGAVLLALPVWTILKIRGADSALDALNEEVRELRRELQLLRTALRSAPPEAERGAPLTPAAPPPAPEPKPESLPPLLPPAVTPPPPAPEPIQEPAAARATPPPVASAPRYVPPPPAPGWTDSINWEQFMGAKLFAWLGGFALFLGIAFFVKYAFEHELIPPGVRVALGFLLGAGLVAGGLRLDRARYRILCQTLVATGVVSLYAVTFACNAVYHFAFFGPIPTFLLMALITAAAFVLAVRLEAQVVAILGLLGGFLTPVLLSTGQDNPAGLFGYIALLDLGLVAVALHRSWPHLVPMGAAGTALMMIGWADRFFHAGKGPVAMTVCVGFALLFQGAAALARRRAGAAREFSWTAAAMTLVGLGFALFFLGYPALVARAGLYLGFVFLLDALLLAQSWRDELLPRLHLVAGMAVFAVLALWTATHLSDELLPWALASYLAFAALHTAFPSWLARLRPSAGPSFWSQFFPPLALVLMLVPLFRLEAVPFLLWPAMLLVDLIAILLAALSGAILAVGAALALTLAVAGVALFRVPVEAAAASSLLVVIGGFGVFFFAASLWLVRRLGDRLPADAADERLAVLFGDTRTQLPAMSSLLPFVLLILACARLHVPEPSVVFGLALLLAVLTLGLAQLMAIEWLPACALAGVAGVTHAWHARQFWAANPEVPLTWYLVFHAVFTVYPFLFRRRFAGMSGPWITAALGGVVFFPLVHKLVAAAWPNGAMGLLPAAFAAAPLASLALVLRRQEESPGRLAVLAWFGGVALLFVTLIFPIQFERQWLTVAWALEGAALCWLFHRVPHPGLRVVGVALLATAFARLALNPAVLGYHARSGTPIFNWYLYAYGLTTAALAAGARLLAPPRERVLGLNAPPLLNTLAVVLGFLLLNLEIADYFTPAGARMLAFQFSGSFARDMTYTIAWALFALGLLVGGIWRQQRAARYAAIGLLSAALLKLFFHDLARLEALYRIGALFGVAVIAILASFAYQRFLPSNATTPPRPD
ncbi:MAG: hypothetical protein C0502_00190 [Opitutus sp.]|nr:hypothetical protein [Opitutus sp.]